MLTFVMDHAARNKLIGYRIKIAREAKGWSQEALADELDTAQTTIARWEAGTFPSRIGLPKIAAALDKPVEWFSEPLPSDSQFEERLKALEEKAQAIMSPKEPYIANPDLQKVWATWDKTPAGLRASALYLITGDEADLKSLHAKVREELKALRKYIPQIRVPKA